MWYQLNISQSNSKNSSVEYFSTLKKSHKAKSLREWATTLCIMTFNKLYLLLLLLDLMVCWILNRNRLISHLSPRERCHFWSSGNQDIFGLYYFWTSILLMYCNLDNKTIPITAYFQATKINANTRYSTVI